jgi:hypothetical protein
VLPLVAVWSATSGYFLVILFTRSSKVNFSSCYKQYRNRWHGI